MSSVLVVDDDEALAATIVRCLKAKGHVAASVSSGRDALAIGRDRGVPDVLVFDLLMPGMDGWDLAERIGANPAWAGTRLVLMTGTRRLPPPWRVHTVLEKPFAMDELFAALERAPSQPAPAAPLSGASAA